MRIARFLLLPILIAAPLQAQGGPTAPASASSRFDAGIVVGAEWLQASDISYEREALPSASFTIGLRRSGWTMDAGWLRIARDLSTVQGGTFSLGRVLSLGPLSIIPAVSLLGGQTYSSRDTTGYEFIDPQGVPGHQARYSYSEGFAFGGGAGLTVELPIFGPIRARVAGSQWFFGGEPLAGDRPRTVVGAGLSVRVKR